MNGPDQDALGHCMGNITKDAEHIHRNHGRSGFRSFRRTGTFVDSVRALNQKLPGLLGQRIPGTSFRA